MSSSTSYPGQQQKLGISQNKVVYVGLIRRPLQVAPEQLGIAFHQAILAVTSDTKEDLTLYGMEKNWEQMVGSNFEFHIVEYMDDSKAYAYKVKIDEKFNYCHSIQSFNDDKYTWNNKTDDFYIKQIYITVAQLKDKMQKIADKKGKYHIKNNNCQRVAQIMLKRINKYQSFFIPEMFQQKKNYQYEAACKFSEIRNSSKQTYSYLKLQELKNLKKYKQSDKNFKF